MAKTSPSHRARGSIHKRAGSYQVRVYADEDPVTGRENRLTESCRDKKQAERTLCRLLTEVDERSNVRTKATLGAALDAWLRVHEAEQTTLAGYEINLRRYIKPAMRTSHSAA